MRECLLVCIVIVLHIRLYQFVNVMQIHIYDLCLNCMIFLLKSMEILLSSWFVIQLVIFGLYFGVCTTATKDAATLKDLVCLFGRMIHPLLLSSLKLINRLDAQDTIYLVL